jgi:phosphoserine phosphatase RsbU/P
MWDRMRKKAARAGDADQPDILPALQEENIRLRRAIGRLALLNDLARAMGVSQNSDEMIQAIVQHVKRALAAEQVMIYFIEHRDGGDVFRTKVRADTTHLRRAFHFDEALLAIMETRRAPFSTSDPHQDPLLRGVVLDQDLRSLLCVPLLIRGTVTGLIVACNKTGGASFDGGDQQLLGIIAHQSAQILETARLREEEVAYERLHRDVQLAREIQSGLLPAAPPRVAGFDLAACSVPAELVGGDYYDFIALDADRVGVCLGDVSGKGVAAALLMANLQATVRGQAHVNATACECVRWANRLLYRSTTPDKFATLFYGILDPRSRTLTYCNAGHERPLLMACSPEGRCVNELATGGLILGIVDEFPYVEQDLRLEPGSTLLIYSDGLTDTVDQLDRPFGVEGVEKVLHRLHEPTAQQVLDALKEAVMGHARDAPAYDDLTLIVIRCPAQSS